MKIDGKAIAADIYQDLTNRVGKLKKNGITPQLVVILVGEDPASAVYVGQKKKWGEFIGAKVTIMNFPNTLSEQTLLQTIKELNKDVTVHGIIVQQPLPKQINPQTIIDATNPQKDIDGFHLQTKFTPPIALAVRKILEQVFYSSSEGANATESRSSNTNITSSRFADTHSNNNFINWIKQKNIVIIGKGDTGGGPNIAYFKKLGIIPQIIDSKTANPDEITKQADIIITTVGKPGIVKPENIKKGVILIGIGMFRGEDGKMHGDYEEKEIKDIASIYTPIPGGVGPVNVACLLENLINAIKIK